MRKFAQLIAALLLCLMVVPASASEPDELKKLKSLTAGEEQADSGKVSALRPKAIEETAYALAVQHGVKFRYDKINEELEFYAPFCDKIYDFKSHLLYRGMMMPPIVVEAGPAHRLEDPKLSIFTDATYKITEEARLLTAPPDWRTYLIKHYDAVIDVHPALYPRNQEERDIWEAAIENGWQVGVKQAQYLFEQGVNRLQRDLCGIIRYRILAQQGVVNVPLIATAQNSVELSEERSKLQMAKTVVRLVKETTFQEEDRWFPAAN